MTWVINFLKEPRPACRQAGRLVSGSLIIFLLSFSSIALAFSRTPDVEIPAVPSSETFSFVVFGDNQDGYEIFERLIEQVNKEDVAFGVHVGDMIQYSTEEDYDRYLEMAAKLRLKLYQVPGNHDLAGNAHRYYRKHFGPYFYSFDHKNAHFVVINNAFKDSFGARQFAWLRKDLAETDKENIFVFMHRPVFDPGEIFEGYVMSGREVTKELMALFEAAGVDYVFAGHIHCYAKVRRDGIIYMVSGGAGGQLHLPRDFGGFHHYVRIDVAGNSITDKVVMVYEEN
ncbi:metallophosphoesterase family protein [Candidatus Margulisiibacteriota bacterium]